MGVLFVLVAPTIRGTLLYDFHTVPGGYSGFASRQCLGCLFLRPPLRFQLLHPDFFSSNPGSCKLACESLSLVFGLCSRYIWRWPQCLRVPLLIVNIYSSSLVLWWNESVLSGLFLSLNRVYRALDMAFDTSIHFASNQPHPFVRLLSISVMKWIIWGSFSRRAYYSVFSLGFLYFNAWIFCRATVLFCKRARSLSTGLFFKLPGSFNPHPWDEHELRKWFSSFYI